MSAHDVFILINNASILVAIGALGVAAYVALRRCQGWRLRWEHRGGVAPYSPKTYRRMP